MPNRPADTREVFIGCAPAHELNIRGERLEEKQSERHRQGGAHHHGSAMEQAQILELRCKPRRAHGTRNESPAAAGVSVPVYFVTPSAV